MLLALCAILVFALPVFAEAVEEPNLIAPAPAAEETLDTSVSGSDEPADVHDTLTIMGQGMVGIFIVMVLIYLVIIILNGVSASSAKKAALKEADGEDNE